MTESGVKSSRKILALKLLFSGTLMFFLYSRVDFRAFGRVLLEIDARMLIPVFGLLVFNTMISTLKWDLLLQADGIRVGYLSLLASYYVGSFFSVFLPSSIGGDVYRVYDVGRRSRRAAEGFASVFAERATGIVALTVYGLVFSVLGYRRLPDPSVVFLPAILFGILALGGVVLFSRDVGLRLMRLLRIDRFPKLAGFAERFLGSMKVYLRNPRLLVRVMTISFVFQIGAITAIYLLGRALGLRVSFLYYCIFVPLIMIAEFLPISIYGVGVRDAGYVFFFTKAGLTREEALSLALAFLLLALVYASIGGLVFLLRPSPPKGGPALPGREDS